MEHQIWICPQCGMEFDLSKSDGREFAILDLIAHVLGIHCGIHDEGLEDSNE